MQALSIPFIQFLRGEFQQAFANWQCAHVLSMCLTCESYHWTWNIHGQRKPLPWITILTYFLQFFLMSIKCVVKSVRSNRTPWIQIACWKQGIKGSGCKCTAPCKLSGLKVFHSNIDFLQAFPKIFENYYIYNKLRSSSDLYLSQISSAPPKPSC